MIRALMFDVDGVIVRPAAGRHWSANLEADLGVSPVALREAFFEPHWQPVVTGQAGLFERLAPALAEIAPTVTPEQLAAYWFEHDAQLDQQVLHDLLTIRSRSLQVHLATNQEHERARYLMQVVGLASYVDGCHYSAAIGHQKPQPEFFQAIVPLIDLHPDELMLIDDSKENVAAAIAAGWSAVHWTPDRNLIDLMKSRAFAPI